MPYSPTDRPAHPPPPPRKLVGALPLLTAIWVVYEYLNDHFARENLNSTPRYETLPVSLTNYAHLLQTFPIPTFL